jgi:hypothetical protein
MWTRPDGDREQVAVSSVWEDRTLKRTFRGKDGVRVNTYSLGPDGTPLTMNAVVTSPDLPGPLAYKLVYRRAPN